MHDRHGVDTLIEEGRQFLELEDYDRAIAVGKRIERARHSYAFELMALAHAGRGNLQEAIATLERGVKLAPSVWLLWQLLGNYYSDTSRWNDAQQAYLRARECPNADESSIDYNVALALLREGKTADALRHCDRVSSPELQLKKSALRIDIYAASGDTAKAVQYAEQVFAEAITVGEENLDEEEAAGIAGVCSAYAHAVWKQGDANQALQLAWQAISWWKHQETAMWLIREIENKRSCCAKHHRLIIEGVWPEPIESKEEAQGFFVTYEVVAESPEEAFDLAVRFEPECVRESLRADECEVLDEVAEVPKGVYYVSGYHQFPIPSPRVSHE